MSKQLQLDALRLAMQEADLPLKKDAKHLVFGKGSADARVVCVGEAPGKNEDERGEPFVGAAGKNLDMLLSSIGLTRENVYITSILKYRPPNNRVPNKAEIASHAPFLVEQLRIIRPHIVVTLGNYATKFILSGFVVEHMDGVGGVSTLHGKVANVSLDSVPLKVIPTFHPAALLYNRSLKESMLSDFKVIKHALG